MIRKLFLLLILTFTYIYSSYAIDIELQHESVDDILNHSVSSNYSFNDFTIEKIIEINNSLNNTNKSETKKIADLYKSLGLIYYNLDLKEISHSYFLKSTEYYSIINNKKKNSGTYDHSNKNSNDIGDYIKKEQHLNSCLEISKDNRVCYLYLADVYNFRDDYNKSEETLRKLIILAENSADSNYISASYLMLGDLKYKLKDSLQAINNYKTALTNTPSNSYHRLFTIYQRLTKVLLSYNQETDGLKYLNYNIKLLEKINNSNLKSEILSKSGKSYYDLNLQSESLKYSFEAVKISKKENNYKVLSFAYKTISNSYYSLHDFKNAFRYSQLHSMYTDSLSTFNQQKLSEFLEIKLKAKDLYKSRYSKNKTKTVTIERTNLNKFLIIFSAIILLLSFITFNRYKQKNKSEAKLKVQSEELKKLSIVASETDNIVIIMDSNGTFQWFNEGFTRITGYKFNEYVKKYGANLKLASFSPDIKKIIDNCINNKKSIHYSTKLITKDKKDIWLQTTLTPVLGEHGNINNLIAIASDITSVKFAEEEINYKNKELESAYRKLLKSESNLKSQSDELAKLSLVARETDNAVMIMDADFNFQWVNEGFIRVYGYTFKQYIDKHGTNLSDTSSNENIVEIIQECIDTKKPVIYTTLCTMNHGKKIWLQTSLTPILDDENKITRIVAIESDIHKIKLAEKEINNKNIELEEANRKLKVSEANLQEINRTKDKFFSIIAHDLRSPFTSFITVSELISENFK